MKTFEQIEKGSEIRIMNQRIRSLIQTAIKRGESKGLLWEDISDEEVEELHFLQDQVIKMGGNLEIN